jgi:hypothetical protein
MMINDDFDSDEIREPDNKRQKTADDTVYTEVFHYKAAQYMYKHWEALSDVQGRESRSIRSYLKTLLDDSEVDPETGLGLLRVKYSRKHEFTRRTGRTLARTKFATLQNLHRTCRHTICQDLYQDIDIANALPHLVCQWAEENGLSVPTLASYVEDRDNMLEEMMEDTGLSRDEAKGLISSVMHGGTKWKAVKETPRWIARLASEVGTIVQEIKTSLPEMWALADTNAREKGRDWTNTPGSAVSLLYQSLEAACLDAMEEQLRTLGHIGEDNRCVLSYDGIMTTSMTVTEDDLHEVEQHVKDVTGYTIVLKLKPFDQIFEACRSTAIQLARNSPRRSLPAQTLTAR